MKFDRNLDLTKEDDRALMVKRKIKDIKNGLFPAKVGLRITKEEYKEICLAFDEYLDRINYESEAEIDMVNKHKEHWGLGVRELG